MFRALNFLDDNASSVFYRPSKREVLVYFLAAGVLLYGCWRMAAVTDPTQPDLVFDFLLSATVASFGFVLAWFVGRRWTVLTLMVALTARLFFIAAPPSEDLSRRVWEGQIVEMGENPYLLTPNSEELTIYRDADWERIGAKDKTSVQTPLTLMVFRVFSFLGFSSSGVKVVFILLDIALCFAFASHFGLDKAVLYAWNPLVIFSVGAGGSAGSLFLVPVLTAYLIWDYSVERRGGAAVINANGGLTGGLGQMVSLSAFLFGVAGALNTAFIPLLLWIVWQTITKSGVKSGAAVLLIGATPIVLSMAWGAFSLDVGAYHLLPARISPGEKAISFFPGLISDLMDRPVGNVRFYYYLTAAISLLLVFKHGSFERFANLYLGVYLVLAPAVFPWTFLWLAPFALRNRHVGFRLVSISGFCYYLGFANSSGEFIFRPLYAAAFWLPFLVGLGWYALTYREKQDGFYVKSH